MTTQQAVRIFNLIQDKYGSPYIIDDEVVSYLNMATHEWLNRLFPDSQGGVVNFEFDSNTAEQVKPLIFELTTTMTSQKVTDEKLGLLLETATGDNCAKVDRILSIGIEVTSGLTTTTYPVKYVKHNNFWVNNRNIFKAPATTTPVYTVVNDGYKFCPSQNGNVKFTVLKKPRELALNPNPVDPELDDYVMYNIIGIALKIAGVATRDEELIVDIRNTGIQLAN